MPAASFSRNFLWMCAGPIVWAVHFLTIYGWTGIACARAAMRQEWLGIGLIGWGIGLATAAALAVIAAMHLNRWRARLRAVENGFIEWTAAALGLMAAVAIVWETVPLFLVPHCR